MGRSSILGGERAATHPPGHDADVLGPSDSSDSGSDIQGQRGLDFHSDSDAAGTGERGSVGPEGEEPGSDILPDHIETISPDASRAEPDGEVLPDDVRRGSASIEADEGDDPADEA
jgi:hypothetical protein